MIKKDFQISIALIRILAGFLVVLIHVSDPLILFQDYKDGFSWEVIYYLNTFGRIAVPLFILVSGYLLLSKPVKNYSEFIKRRFSKVGIPALLWTIAFFIWVYFIPDFHLTFFKTLQMLWTVDINYLYFIVVILELYLITPLFLSIKNKFTTKQQVLFTLFLFIVSISTTLLSYTSQINFEKNILTIFIPYSSYFFAGSLLPKVKVSNVNYILGVVLIFISPFLTNYFARGDQTNFFTTYFSPTIIIPSVLVFILLKSLENFFSGSLNKKSKSAVLFLSSTIFGIYLIHHFIFQLTQQYLRLKPGNFLSPIWGFEILTIIFVFIISLLTVGVVKKVTNSEIIFG